MPDAQINLGVLIIIFVCTMYTLNKCIDIFLLKSNRKLNHDKQKLAEPVKPRLKLVDKE